MQPYSNNPNKQQQSYQAPTQPTNTQYQSPQQNTQYPRPTQYVASTNGYTAPNSAQNTAPSSLNNSFNNMSLNASPVPSTYRPQPISYNTLPKPNTTPTTYGQPRSYAPPSIPQTSATPSPVQPQLSRPVSNVSSPQVPTNTATLPRPTAYVPPTQTNNVQPQSQLNAAPTQYRPQAIQPLQPTQQPAQSPAVPQPIQPAQQPQQPINGYQAPRPLPTQPTSPNTQSLSSFTQSQPQQQQQQQPLQAQPLMASVPPSRLGYQQPAAIQPTQSAPQQPAINGTYNQQVPPSATQQYNNQLQQPQIPQPMQYNAQQQQQSYQPQQQNGYTPPQQYNQPYQNNANNYNAGYDGQANMPNGYNDQYNNNQYSNQYNDQYEQSRRHSGHKQMIDPSQIPRPEFKTSGAVVKYHTKSGYSPPGACTDYTVIDEGNASPRFIRMTTNAIGINDEMIHNTKLSIGAVLQPLAELGDQEAPIPIVDYATGPIRCIRCLAYINPGFTFIDGGTKYVCNICGTKNDCPVEYQCNLDANGYRRDRYDRAELCCGSVEFVVGSEFINKPLNDPVFLFVVDVSYAAILTGVVDTAVQAIRSIIESKSADTKVRMGIITYDNSVQFYSLKPTQSTEPTLFVMADVDDPFVPCPSDEIIVYVHNEESRNLLNATLDMISTLYNRTKATENLPAVGAAVSSAVDTLLPTGGKVLLMQTNLPLIGCGTLTNRDNSALYYTDKEKSLQLPQSPFYHTIATTAAENSITIDLFVCTNTYVDIATVGVICEKTGGQIYNYPGFNNRKDGLALARDLYHDTTRTTGYDGVMIVRCSAGLRVAELYGNFYHRRPLEMDLPTIDADKSFGVRFEHDGTLKDKSEVCIQSALLYTTSNGDRRIRVHSIMLQTTAIIGNLFRYSDLDAIINLSLKQVVRQLIDTTTTYEAQQSITQACIDSLYMYRKYCATSTSAGQLILPEPLKLLPLSTIALIKHPLFQDGIAADERSFLFQYVNSMPAYVSVAFVCPRLFSVQALLDQPYLCVPDAEGHVSLPGTLDLSSEKVTSYDIYLLDDSRFVYMYVAPDTNDQLVHDVFDVVQDGRSVQYKLKQNQATDSIAARINVLVETLRRHKPYYQNLQVIVGKKHSGNVPQAESLDERQFFDHLIEDKVTNPKRTVQKQDSKIVNPNTMSYIDFLVWLHRKIQQKFTTE